jgi:catechol-2,3-dioxygenase
MAKIKHLAMITLDPDALAKFYCDVFDMKILERGKGGEVYLTDGYLTLALLNNKAEGKPNGLNHFGFQIDDQEEIAKRLTDYGLAQPAKRPADRPYAETRATDPDGNNFDLSVHGFQVVEFAKQRDETEKELV